MDTTIVTCFYIIKSKFPIKKYLKWIENFLSFNFNCIIFTNKETEKLFFNNFKSLINKDNFKIIILEISDFYTSKHNWDYDLSIDHEIKKGISHSIELYKIWNEKIFFLSKAIELDLFNNNYFLWIDIGSFRNKKHTNIIQKYMFPQSHNFIKQKVSVFLIEDFKKEDLINLFELDNRFKHCNRIGGLFGGDVESLTIFKDKYIKLLDDFKSKKIFSGKDQTLYNFLTIQNQDLINIINANVVHPNYDPWFCFHYHFSNYTPKPLISILIPIYNGIEFIQEALNSILKQTFTNYEILIGINGHEFRSEVYNKAFQYKGKNCIIHDFGKLNDNIYNKKSYTLNKLKEHCRGDWIALLDIDDIWIPNKLKIQLNFINKFDIIGTKCVYFGNSNNKPNIPIHGLENHNFLIGNPIINSSCLIKKELCYWDENCFIEDYDLWLRLWKNGHKFYNIDQILTKHRIHKKSFFNNNHTKKHLKTLHEKYK